MEPANVAQTPAPVGEPIVEVASADAGQSLGGESSASNNIDESALRDLNVDSASERDSALGDMTPEPSTMSARSSIYDYVEENGRTYHRYKEGKYYLPNDEAEKDRLDLQHQLWMLTLRDELYLAPVKEPHAVLDIGTGTGIWAIEFANRHPEANVIGSDLSPIQPDYVPANCHFEVDDAEDDWNYSTKFNFIHGRALVTCFRDFVGVFKQAYDALAPGGYFEMQDLVVPMRAIDHTMDGTALKTWTEVMMGTAEKMGKNWGGAAHYGRYFEEAGFVDVVEKHFQWPSNRWPKGERLKTLGSYWMEDMTAGAEGLSLAILTRGAGMTREEVVDLSDRVRVDLKNKAIHAYCPIIVVYGRKPLAEEMPQ